MPEYLAPGVYVEEVELGPRPIEGVSTSTTGFVGMARRGPVNLPTFVAGFGEYNRYFGTFLDEGTYGDRRWLPFAVQAFFANGGSRAFIVRVANLPASAEDLADTTDKFAKVAYTFLPNQADARRSLWSDAAASATSIELAYSGGLEVGTLIQIGDGATGEIVTITGFSDRVQFEPALARPHDAGAGVTVMELSDAAVATLDGVPPNRDGAATIRVGDPSKLSSNGWARIESTTPEYVLLGAVPAGETTADVPLAAKLGRAHDPGTQVTQADAPVATTTLAAAAAAAAESIWLTAVDGLSAGGLVVLGGDAAHQEVAVLGTVPADKTAIPDTTDEAFEVPVTEPLRNAHAASADVSTLTFNGPALGTAPPSTELVPGIKLSARGGLEMGDVVSVGTGDEAEMLRLMSDPADRLDVTVDRGPRFSHDDGTDVFGIEFPTGHTSIKADVRSGGDTVEVEDVGRIATGDVIEILDDGSTEYAVVLATGEGTLTLQRPLAHKHSAGARVRRLSTTLKIMAGPSSPDPELYPEPGTWGNDLEIRVDATSALRTSIASPALEGDPWLELVTANNISVGSILRLPGNRYGTVTAVQGRRVFLEHGVPASVSAADVAATDDDAWRKEVSIVDFKLSFSYGGEFEAFDSLSMDPQHPNYVETVVNRDSRLVHVEVMAHQAPAPENLPLSVASWHPGGGTDGLSADPVALYQGMDAADADRRSGLFALLNAADVSIAAVPGASDPQVQLALIQHCEAARYRFAVLDGANRATVDGVLRQRQLYDSKYAALYYPWLKVFDPLTNKQVYAPPSGAVAGIYARTDNEIGVHKAPANAVVSQVTDVQFTVGKAQQDRLNPAGVNAIRPFPGRGIRVWGARTISSDSLWRYVNVRRLFIFLERSIDESTQYVVFEPNDLPLWNRVKASVTAFLTTVWRSGALQGTTADEAFFVKCGLGETMIQADIDAGRVIILIGVAPVKPAEFVIFRIGQKPGGSALAE